MTHITCRLTAKNRDQLWNPTLSNRVWATFCCCVAYLIVPVYRAAVCKSCVLKPEDLTDGLRILFLKDGLFYEGRVKEVMPPDV